MGLMNNIRQSFFTQVKVFQSQHPHLKIELHEIEGRTNFRISPETAVSLMQHSLLCPILRGDAPYQHRLFDVLAAGCIPVVISDWNDEKNCTIHWTRDDSPQQLKPVGNDGACMDDMYIYIRRPSRVRT
jgi:hypothetical protein